MEYDDPTRVHACLQVEEMRQRLEDKNRMIEQKTQAAMQAQQERNRMSTELTELKDHMDIKDKKINVLLRKVSALGYYPLAILSARPTSNRGSNLKLTLCWLAGL